MRFRSCILLSVLAIGALFASAQTKTTATAVEFVHDGGWKSNTGSSVNSVASDAFVAFQDSASGNLTVINQASKEMAGGLVSDNASLPADFSAHYFELMVQFTIAAEDMPHLARHETDLKITLKNGSSAALPNQANGSCQWNADRQTWQLDPSGSTWVDSGYTKPPVVGTNTLRIQFWSDGTAKWSVTGISLNGDAPFVPPAATFQNIPLVTTNWGTGLHPQLQTEVKGAPWYFREQYSHVIVISSDSPIAWVPAA